MDAGRYRAGADPGPACYGLGGEPTVTDADVTLGYLDREYERLYKRLIPEVAVEALNWRVIVAGPRPTINMPQRHGPTAAAAPCKGERPVYFPETSGYIPCPVYDRYQLAPGMTLQGPAIIEERESTAVVGPGAGVDVDALQNVVIWLPT